MSRERLKPGAIAPHRRKFRYKLSEKLMAGGVRGLPGLLFGNALATSAAPSRQRYSALGVFRARPWIRAISGFQVAKDRHERTPIHLPHGRSDQDLSGRQEGPG